jgi:tetraacyldisaccharide 4'-kinase
MLRSLSRLYGWVVERRNRRYDAGKASMVSVDVPVISVGNILAGGTGKTPVTQMIARMLMDMGHRPAIIMRGYRRSTRGLLVVHDGVQQLASAREAGDEAALHAERLGIPVVVAEHRVDAAAHAAGFLPCDVIIMDDGFQHRALRRDLDVILVNRRTLDEAGLLPKGRLREPLSSMKRADVILLTGEGIRADDVAEQVGPTSLVGRIQITADAASLQGMRVLAFCGIADPDRFHATVKACGADVVERMNFADHYSYQKADIVRIVDVAREKGLAVVTTEKDRVKLDKAEALFHDAGVQLITIPIVARLVDGEQEFVERLKDLMDEDRRH